MLKASGLSFIKMLTSGKKVELTNYGSSDRVYESVDFNDGELLCYLVSPEVMKKYLLFVDEMHEECPLLLELL
jgi:hypothetical protein